MVDRPSMLRLNQPSRYTPVNVLGESTGMFVATSKPDPEPDACVSAVHPYCFYSAVRGVFHVPPTSLLTQYHVIVTTCKASQQVACR